MKKRRLGKSELEVPRRLFLRTTGIIAAATITGGLSLPTVAQESGRASSKSLVKGRRKLGKLEVSSVGFGCQDMTGTFLCNLPAEAGHDHSRSHGL